jgi:hypothetical protein
LNKLAITQVKPWKCREGTDTNGGEIMAHLHSSGTTRRALGSSIVNRKLTH